MSTITGNERMTLLINSCEKYSDLWSGHVKLLERNFPQESFDRILLTDEKCSKDLGSVNIISAGSGTEMPERIKYVLPFIRSEYVLVTLDDYYLIEPVDVRRINALLDAMDSEKIDYIRLFKRPPSRIKIEGHDSLFLIDLNSKKDYHYQVNLYPGIWRKSFLEKTLAGVSDAWNYELSLTRTARENNTKCAMTYGKEFVILDVVRKGKLLHKANAYFKKHPGIYEGDRKVISRFTELKIDFMTLLKLIFNQSTIDSLKSFFRRFGVHFYSDGNGRRNS